MGGREGYDRRSSVTWTLDQNAWDLVGAVTELLIVGENK